MPGPTSILRARFMRFRREIMVMIFSLVRRGTPLRLRAASLAVLAYLVSPFDLLPELVPLVGILDDVAIVPWAISLIVRRIPAPQREAAEARADRFLNRWFTRPFTFLAALLLVLLLLWVLAFLLVWLWLGW